MTPRWRLNRFVEEPLARLGPGELILDLGSGRGYWLEQMSTDGLHAVGIEPDSKRASLAARFAPIAVADACNLPIRDGAVGLIWCIHVLHHLGQPDAAVAEMLRVLRPGGHLVVAETVEDSPLIRMARHARPEWDGVAIESRFTAEQLAGLLAGAGFEPVARRQHALISFAAWSLPRRMQPHGWRALSRLEQLTVPRGLNRFGAHSEHIVRKAVPSS